MSPGRSSSHQPRVHIVCQEWQSDRVLPRIARALSQDLGWTISQRPEPCDVLYLSVYFEGNGLRPWPEGLPILAYFSHKEEEPPTNPKIRDWDKIARKVSLRITTAKIYEQALRPFGPTARVPAPLDRAHFPLMTRPKRSRPTVGLAGYTYPNRRKGQDLVQQALLTPFADKVHWRASGRGWPLKTIYHAWKDIPGFYQSLDVLLCPSRVEGIPLPPLEMLSTGGRVVIPEGVGLLDDLDSLPGIYRYRRGDAPSMVAALERACWPQDPISPEALSQAVSPYSLHAWSAAHKKALQTLFGEGAP